MTIFKSILVTDKTNKNGDIFLNNVMFNLIERPGYFGRSRDRKINKYNRLYGKNNWQLYWKLDNKFFTFEQACKYCYEKSYYQYLQNNPQDLKYICSFKECYDNDISNIDSGTDYLKQESNCTHIQDIAIRNVLKQLNLSFSGTELLQIRSHDSNGFQFNPGNIPFFLPDLIVKPSLRPKWSKANSVEDYWQSNKYLGVNDVINRT